MNTDPQIVAQATCFVNALRHGQRAHVPALRFAHWPQFIRTVRHLMENAA